MFGLQKIKKSLIVVFFLLFPILIFASSEVDMEDTFRELDEDKLTLNFFNAVDGKAIEGGSIKIEKIGNFKTDTFGKIYFDIPEDDGTYKIIFEKSGYIKSALDIEIEAGSLFFNRFSISPTISFDSVRVVLDWGKKPNDLDIHLERKGEFHISYRNKKKVDTAYDIAELDKDDQNGFGPETITLEKISKAGKYKVYVKDYSNRRSSKSYKLSKSKAHIKIYTKNHFYKVFKVPINKRGTIWEVFTIENGEIHTINKIK